MKNYLSVEIASSADREGVVAEIWCDKEMIAELNLEVVGKVSVEFYPKPGGGAWVFDYEDIISALEKAKNELLIKNNN